jgi:transposase
MPRGRTFYIVTLTKQERADLEKLVSSGHHAARKINHARILLLSDRNLQGPAMRDADISKSLNTGVATIGRVRKRFVEEGLEAALVPKPSKRIYKKIVDGKVEARLTMIACSDPPEGHERWSMQLLAEELVLQGVVESISRSTVHRVLKKTN